MSRHRSKKHHLEQGPGLQVLICAKDGFLTHVDLVLGDSGITWMLEADQSLPPLEKALDTWFKQYSMGQEPTVVLPLNLYQHPPFRLQVLNALQKVPFGTVLSYQDLARKLRNPQAARAVGNACGANPLPFLIPCHRIIASDKTLGGYSIGHLSIKKALLDFEGVSL